MTTLHMTGHPSSKGWFDGTKYIQYSEIPTPQLRKLKAKLQHKELVVFNKWCTVIEKIDALSDKIDAAKGRARGMRRERYAIMQEAERYDNKRMEIIATVTAIDEEAAKRGIKIRNHGSKYHRNQRKNNDHEQRVGPETQLAEASAIRDESHSTTVS